MADKPIVYVSRGLPPHVLQQLSADCQVKVWKEEHAVPREELIKNAPGAHALIVLPTERVDAELLDAVGPQLKVVATWSAGLDHLDLEECRWRGVALGYTPGILTTAVAELTVGLLLATAHRLKEALQAVHDGIWGTRWDDGLWMAGSEIYGSTVGIVGLGRIGLAVAKRIQAFEPAKILYCGHSPKPAAQEVGAEYLSFPDLLKSSDVVIGTCSVSAENRHLFNRQAFVTMKPSAIFINVSRGDLVDQDALYEALTSGQLAAAGLDVTSPEPLPPDHPLLQLPNCTVAPHIAISTSRAVTESARVTVSNVLAGLKGQPLPCPVP